MFTGTKPTYRKKDDVLNQISQEQAFHTWLGIYPDLNKRFLSPFRTDNNPGCRFCWYSGILWFVENTMFNNKLYWSCIDVVQYVKQCSYMEALNILWKQSYTPQTLSKAKTPSVFVPEIRFEKKLWSDENMFMLSGEVLEKELVYCVKNYWIKTKAGWLKNSIHDPQKTLTIAYYFPDTNHVKLYFPEQVENRWYSNCSIQDIFGWHKIEHYKTISDKLVITKSGKDRLMLDYHLDQPAIALQNEGCFMPGDIAMDLSMMFKEVVFIYDNDTTGILQAQKLSEKYSFSYKVIECEPKDPFEMIQEFGVTNTSSLIKS